MKKFKLAILLGVVLSVVLAGTALADGLTIVPYTDTGGSYKANENNDPVSYVNNGDFNEWSDAGFVWDTWGTAPSGWTVTGAKVDLSEGGDGMSYGMGFTISSDHGAAGGAYAGIVQQLNDVPAAGTYFVNVSVTSWATDAGSMPYNNVAWYAISDSAEASGVAADEWKELYPDVYVCENGNGVCNYVGRDEMVTVEPGQYFHVKVGRKFAGQGATTFVIDDISLFTDDKTSPNNGFYNWRADDPDASCKWHYNAETTACSSPNNRITWNPNVAR